MPQTIFFSWQADTSKLVGRNLIDRALEKALGRIGTDTELEEAVRDLEIDRDTKGVAGSPPIVDTIFKKIDAATVFLPDLTFVGQRLDGRPSPNPNVLIEYGWALKSLTHGRVVPVMNTAFGEPTAENMPFDMRHLRYPILYHCPADATEDERRQAREGLAKALEAAIRAVLMSPELQRGPAAPIVSPFVPRTSGIRSAVFHKEDEFLGISTHFLGSATRIHLEDGPAFWLRVMPANDQGKLWSVDELEGAATQYPYMQPLNRNWQGLGHYRRHDGFGTWATGSDEETYGTACIFRTGEIWSIDTFILSSAAINDTKVIALRENDYRGSILEYSRLLRKIGVTGDLKWIAGMDGVKGRGIYIPSRDGYRALGVGAHGNCMLDEVIETGVFNPDHEENDVLRPFFERVYESCGARRPNWLNQQPAKQ